MAERVGFPPHPHCRSDFVVLGSATYSLMVVCIGVRLHFLPTETWQKICLTATGSNPTYRIIF